MSYQVSDPFPPLLPIQKLMHIRQGTPSRGGDSLLYVDIARVPGSILISNLVRRFTSVVDISSLSRKR